MLGVCGSDLGKLYEAGRKPSNGFYPAQLVQKQTRAPLVPASLPDPGSASTRHALVHEILVPSRRNIRLSRYLVAPEPLLVAGGICTLSRRIRRGCRGSRRWLSGRGWRTSSGSRRPRVLPFRRGSGFRFLLGSDTGFNVCLVLLALQPLFRRSGSAGFRSFLLLGGSQRRHGEQREADHCDDFLHVFLRGPRWKATEEDLVRKAYQPTRRL